MDAPSHRPPQAHDPLAPLSPFPDDPPPAEAGPADGVDRSTELARWRAAGREALVSGTLASVASATALALAGRREAGAAAAPTNATSQWLWGDRALREDRPTLRHTATGYLIHHGAALFWAVLPSPASWISS